MGKIAIDLVAADAIVDTYRTTSAALDHVRRTLATPWRDAVAQLGDRYGSVPDTLRLLGESTDAGARDLEWRVHYIRARYGDPAAHRMSVVELPRRLPELQVAGTAELIGLLRTGEDPKAIREALDELLVRAAGETGVAVAMVRRLTAADVDRLLTHPDLIGDADDFVVPLQLLIAWSQTAQPMEAAHLLDGDEPIDVLRIALLLRSGAYGVATVADALARIDGLMSDPTFVWRYATLPTALADGDATARGWLLTVENPAFAVVDSIEDPADAFALLQMPGLVELLGNLTPNLASGQASADELAEANRVLGKILDLAVRHLDAMFDRAASGDPAAVAAFEKALAESYDILLALRDHAPKARVGGDPVRDAAARLTAWHFRELAKGGWPLGESAGEFARWLSVSDEALALLVVGTSAFLASILPTLVARFEADPGEIEVAAAVPLDELRTVLSFLTFALSESGAAPEAVSAWRTLLDLIWSAIMTIAPGKVIPGTGDAITILRALFRRLASSGYSKLGAAGGLVGGGGARDIDSIADVLGELFFTLDGFEGSNDIEDVRPLQIALFGLLLGYRPESVDSVPGLADFVVDGNLVPPPIDDPEYARFLQVFAEATTSESDLARHYIRVWDLITEWATKGVQSVEISSNQQQKAENHE